MRFSLKERLARFAHIQWSGWMDYVLSLCTINEDGTATVPAWAVQRWKRQINTLYEDLPEKEKWSDRREAQGMIDVILDEEPYYE